MRWTRQDVAKLLRERGLRPRRSLGQNFLVDANFLEAIVRDAEVGPQDGVVEVGSGIGNLTDRLAEKAGHVWAFEVDPGMIGLARELLAGRGNVTLFERDGLESATLVDPRPCRRLKVVSNLPYSEWKRLLLGLLSSPHDVDSYTLMLQRDVWDRLRARPGTREYGPMAVLLQGACEARMVRPAGKGLFYPIPLVDSVVLSVRRKERSLDFAAAEARLRALFAGRRKKSAAAGGRRVEDLPPAELLALARP
jgi:16S rRNA (adenine1518-N6/adenine1519-N6)-dimethyltransferase